MPATARRSRHVRSATRSASSASSVPTGDSAATVPARCAFQSFGHTSGSTGESDRSPCLTAFSFATAFPFAVFGPFENLPFVWFASIFASVVLA